MSPPALRAPHGLSGQVLEELVVETLVVGQADGVVDPAFLGCEMQCRSGHQRRGSLCLAGVTHGKRIPHSHRRSFRLRYADALCVKRLWQCGHGSRRATIGREPYLRTPRSPRSAAGCVRWAPRQLPSEF